MKVEINISDYLDQDDIKEVCRGVLREQMARKYQEENIAYFLMQKFVSEVMDQEVLDRLKSRVLEKIDLSEFYLSQHPDFKRYVDEVMANQSDRIKSRAIERLEKDIEGEFYIGHYLSENIMKILKAGFSSYNQEEVR